MFKSGRSLNPTDLYMDYWIVDDKPQGVSDLAFVQVHMESQDANTIPSQYDVMLVASEVFGTTHINLRPFYADGHCDTCDLGCRFGWDMYIPVKEIK